MAKAKTRFFCTECGHETSGWLGKCPGCGAWNTLVEERVVTGSTSTKPSRRTSWLDEGHTAGVAASGRTEVINLGQVVADRKTRLSSGLSELDRVLGGGFVRGSLILLGGDPGIGKFDFAPAGSGPFAPRNENALHFRRGITRTDPAAGRPAGHTS